MVFRWKNKYTVKYNNKKNKLRMEYRVLIALNSIGKRRVGDIIALFERVGFEILNFRKVKRSSRVIEFPDIKTLVLENQLTDLDAMSYYKSHLQLLFLPLKNFTTLGTIMLNWFLIRVRISLMSMIFGKYWRRKFSWRERNYQFYLS